MENVTRVGDAKKYYMHKGVFIFGKSHDCPWYRTCLDSGETLKAGTLKDMAALIDARLTSAGW